MTLALERIDWERAIEEFKRLARERGSSGARRKLADASSLSVLFEGDFRVGSARIADALRLEPLNPLHHLRKARHALRFGAWELSLAALERVAGVVDPPHPQLRCASCTG